MNRALAVLLSAVVLLSAAPVRADDANQSQLTELSRKVDALTQEIEKLKLGDAAETPAPAARPGFGPSASKVYGVRPDKISFGGYGEFVYLAPSRHKQNGDDSGLKKTSDLRRFVLYTGYKFNDWILFNSEFEVEHAGTGQGDEKRGEIGVEQDESLTGICMHEV